MKRLLVIALLVACGGGDGPKLSVEELQDPATCMECHPKHYQQWSGSMHAYASEDPVFVAMNARGQRETNGALGDFCVSCHAPMALALGEATGANFDPAALSPRAKGVTCFFCHNVSNVTDIHNNPLTLAMDQTMRGGLEDPKSNPAHHSKYDTLMDSDRNESEMCGACHDITVPEEVNGVPGGVAVERTFAEWKETFFHTDKTPNIHLTCGNCHLLSSTDVVADFDGVELRPNGFHDHSMPAIDQALTPFPEIEAQARGIKEILEPAIAIVGPNRLGDAPLGGICVTPLNVITVRLDSFSVGHSFPSGSAFDRRVWVEVIAYNAQNQPIFQSGIVPDGMDPEQINDPMLFGLWDRAFKQDGSEAHFFWEVATIQSELLKGPVTNDPLSPLADHSITHTYELSNANPPVSYADIERVTARVRLRPLPFSTVDLLIGSGDLASEIRDRIPTIEIASTRREWKRTARDPGSGCCTAADACRPSSNFR